MHCTSDDNPPHYRQLLSSVRSSSRPLRLHNTVYEDQIEEASYLCGTLFSSVKGSRREACSQRALPQKAAESLQTVEKREPRQHGRITHHSFPLLDCPQTVAVQLRAHGQTCISRLEYKSQMHGNGRRAASVSGSSAKSGGTRETAGLSRAKWAPGSIARSGLSVATGGPLASPFVANQAEQFDRTEAHIMMSAVMAPSASDARLRRMAEARIISAALAEEHDLVGLRMQRRELEDEEKRLRAMLDVERTRVRHARAVAAAASVALGYSIGASGGGPPATLQVPPHYAGSALSAPMPGFHPGGDSVDAIGHGGGVSRGLDRSTMDGTRAHSGAAGSAQEPVQGLQQRAPTTHWWHQQPALASASEGVGPEN